MTVAGNAANDPTSLPAYEAVARCLDQAIEGILGFLQAEGRVAKDA